MTGTGARARVGYAGRPRIDSSLATMRRSLLRLARLAARDEGAARALDAVVDQVAATIDNLTQVIDGQFARSDGAQAQLRRELAKVHKLMAAAGSPEARAIAERQADSIRAQLETQDV